MRGNRSPSVTSTRRTVPGIWAASALSVATGPRSCAAASTSGGAAGGGGGAFSLQAPCQGAGAEVGWASESGGFSTRKAVVVRPARTCGMRDQPAEEGEIRRHALDLRLAQRVGEPVECLVRGSRRARRASRSSGRSDRPISSPSSTPASTRIDPRQLGVASMRPVCGRNVRGSSAYSRTSTAWPAAA